MNDLDPGVAENTQNLRIHFLCVYMILCSIFLENPLLHEVLATKGFAKNDLRTHNQFDCCDEVSESRAVLKNKHVASSRISSISNFVACASGGFTCPR